MSKKTTSLGEKVSDKKFSKEEEELVRQRLRALGYLD